MQRGLLSAAFSIALGLVLFLASVPLPASAHMASSAKIHSAYEFAKTRKGDTYVYGGTGPHRFDCSGLVQWVYKKVGKHLPRTAAEQARWGHRISRSEAIRGDLVFFHDSRGHVYHAGIYAGHHRVFHASRPGKPVGFEKIWTSSVYYERAR